MRHAPRRYGLTLVVTLAGLVALSPSAQASVSPTMSLDQSAGTTAGGTANLGLDLKFSDSGTDSPHDLVINLPPGLLANAALDGGACLRTAQLSGSSCEVGSGTVTATPDVLGVINPPLPVSVPVTFYLVPPPTTGDLAGLAVVGLGEQLGATGDIRIRPTGDPDGVGVTLKLALPDQLPLALGPLGTVNLTQISLTEINSTFNSLRYPATCPAAPAGLTAAVDSYSDSTVHTVTAPLSVTRCSALTYSPAFSVIATRDSNDRQVQLRTTITQAPGQAPSRSVSLAFPTATLAPNIESIAALCRDLAAGSCQPVGAATATSPLYPTPLTGTAYLTGTSSGLMLTLVFPSPFPLTLNGAVDLIHNSATFTGLPDIPLTNLGVSLSGGADGLFLSTCQTPSGSATAMLTDQNGDKSATVPARFTVAGCTSTSSGAATIGGGSTGGGGQPAGAPTVTSSGVAGLRSGHPSLRFRITQSRHAAKLSGVTIELPVGLRFVAHPRAGIRLTGATLKSLRLSHGHLTITLRHPVRSLTITIGSAALTETAALKAKAETLTHLRLTVITTNTANKHSTIHVVTTSAAA
ncbi:MAG TPA: hypothetical protein VMP89_18360 [Solirubrobacteraceae bacterium]|nr:hypothetical protein [Solirubrobacteraceae bacterium]